MNDEKDNLTGHEYDGIQEYDNPLPNWWLMTFFATIIFGSIYWLHYESGSALTQLEELKADLTEIEVHSKQGHGHEHGTSAESEEELKKLLADAPFVAKGKDVFLSKCAACHGQELQGIIGPNLVDDYWIHGTGHPSEIMAIVSKGVLEKGMPAWEAMLKGDEIKSVVVYVASMHGTKPANPKPPQGEKIGGQ